ncbi:hypothetical protein BESB_073730 [Besnoitia besnoiti]|uniref:CLASP N-terminal domain-containing protein n=1 Tax=Besnoitia besnoiti TaxID=94643 RepID=A0A2A9MD44_BESBE|nr:uncharacterized protein BESB_073730 [Besnoitia besnoiti]PFH34221.1 hypothetical protein BESB_073730 [Besnoitia besnoiti]
MPFRMTKERGEDSEEEAAGSLSVSREVSQGSQSPEPKPAESAEAEKPRVKRMPAKDRIANTRGSASRSLSRRDRGSDEEATLDANMEDALSSPSQSFPAALRHPSKLQKPAPPSSTRRELASRVGRAASPSLGSSGSSAGTRKGDSQERAGPSGLRAKSGRPLGLQLGGRNAGALRYLTHEELQPFDEAPSVKTIEETILPRLGEEVTKGDWTEQIETLDTLRRLAKYHFCLLTPDILRQAVSGVLAWLASPRSTVAKNACLALSDLFFFGKKKMDPWIVEVVELAMKKCCQSNEFLNEAVRSVLFTACQSTSEARVLHAFLHCIPPCKQHGARSMAACCLAVLFQKSGEQVGRHGELPQVVKLLLNMATEASADVRVTARVALTILHNQLDGATLRRVCGSLDARNKMDSLVSRTTAKEIEDTLRTAETSTAPGGGRASLSSSLSSLPDEARSGARGRTGNTGGSRLLFSGQTRL